MKCIIAGIFRYILTIITMIDRLTMFACFAAGVALVAFAIDLSDNDKDINAE